ncbi:hypothetical protein BDW67DRAFT_182819 [Aspergillus spinulosporus]
MNPNSNLNTGRTGNSSFADQFNANVDYTRSRMGQSQGDTTGMGQSETQTRGQNLAQAQADAQNEAQAGTAAGTGSSGALGNDFSKGPSELETSIDSTNAGVDHRRTSYSFTAATLAHPNDRAGPDE